MSAPPRVDRALRIRLVAHRQNPSILFRRTSVVVSR